jgi:hypothetical protein
VAFEVRVAKVEELTEGPPHELAIENAYRKAAAVSELSRLASTPATPDATVTEEPGA